MAELLSPQRDQHSQTAEDLTVKSHLNVPFKHASTQRAQHSYTAEDLTAKSHVSMPRKKHAVQTWQPSAKLSQRDSTQRRLYTEKLSHRNFQAENQAENLLHREDSAKKVLHRPSFYTENFLHRETFAQRIFHTEKLLHNHISFYTVHIADFSAEKLSQTANLCTQSNFLHGETFTQGSLLHREAFTQGNFYTEIALTQRSFCTGKLLHRDRSYTGIALTQRSFYTKKLLHREAFTQRSFLHRDALTQRSFYTEAFTLRSFYTEKLLHREAFAERSFRVHSGSRNCRSKIRSRMPTSGTCQLDSMIFELLLYFRNMPSEINDLWSTSGLQEHATGINWT